MGWIVAALAALLVGVHLTQLLGAELERTVQRLHEVRQEIKRIRRCVR